MYHRYSLEELRGLCRAHIENLEIWARRLIHEILTRRLGADYIHVVDADGNHVFGDNLVRRVDNEMKKHFQQRTRPVDAMYLVDVIDILCNDDFYDKYFSEFFEKKFPGQAAGLREILDRLKPIRNALSHANPISVRDAEQCVCYSNDFIDCVKEYYRKMNQEKEFNVPTVIRITDSFGREYPLKEEPVSGTVSITVTNPNNPSSKAFYIGDKFTLYLTVDPSFDEQSYTLEWWPRADLAVLDGGKQAVVTITNKLVGERTLVSCKVITNNDWHRRSEGYDQMIIIKFKALPLKTN